MSRSRARSDEAPCSRWGCQPCTRNGVPRRLSLTMMEIAPGRSRCPMPDRPVIDVLVVDDTLANRWVLTRVLEEGGYRVIEGETAADAVRLAAQRPDLIVLDVRLPDGSGFEIARGMKADPQTSDIPLLLISASFTSPSERARGLDAGADGY